MTIATTPRLGLPLMAPGQAQKEMVHNEALTLADMLVQPMAETLGRNDPPPAPLAGQAWILGAAPGGAWSGQANAIAAWTEGGWRFCAAREGMQVFVRDTALFARFAAGVWTAGMVDATAVRIGGDAIIGPRQAGIASPSGGATVDAEARIAIAAILAAVRAHGLISS